ncbi:hypothetical protein VC290_09120 [Xanthomonas campestris]|uniref:hypothetical protein n=1 Tax=Xanthomonas campestris TaxID=339 RepID=UPI002B239D11|nr:hypothetical protein [Xanthomonas campestris]MEA9480542.1 hypothetical protein [Xanthomonas campestris]
MTERDEHIGALAKVLEQDLLHHYGPVIGQDDLRQALGYTSLDAFRQALSRDSLPVPVFPIPNRRGKIRACQRHCALAGRLARPSHPGIAPKRKHAVTANMEDRGSA